MDDLQKVFVQTTRVQELCESRGGHPGLPVPNKPNGLCGREATLNCNPNHWTDLNLRRAMTETQPCLRAQELCESRGGRPGSPVPNKPYGFCGRLKATFEEQPWRWDPDWPSYHPVQFPHSPSLAFRHLPAPPPPPPPFFFPFFFSFFSFWPSTSSFIENGIRPLQYTFHSLARSLPATLRPDLSPRQYLFGNNSALNHFDKPSNQPTARPSVVSVKSFRWSLTQRCRTERNRMRASLVQKIQPKGQLVSAVSVKRVGGLEGLRCWIDCSGWHWMMTRHWL